MSLRVFGGGGGGSLVTGGTATVDFGSFPGSLAASVTVTGQTGILASSRVRAWLTPTATGDNNADEHIIASTLVDVVASDVTAGVGFTVRALVRDPRTEPLGHAARDRHVGSGTVATDTGGFQGPTPSVGGTVVGRLVGTYTAAWEWV